MDIENHPQFQLYLLTLKLLKLKNHLIPENCDERCINSTIINRAYYSAYLYCELWLKKVKRFTTIPPWKFKGKRISEHKQIRQALIKEFNEKEVGHSLRKLAFLRQKADYHPYKNLNQKEVADAITYMEKIFATLKFD